MVKMTRDSRDVLRSVIYTVSSLSAAQRSVLTFFVLEMYNDLRQKALLRTCYSRAFPSRA